MDSKTPDDMLDRLSGLPEPTPGPAFNAAVWQRIDGSPRDRRKWFDDFVPALGWRAAPACLALVVGTVAGSMIVREHQGDALDVFDPESAYSIVVVVGTGAGAR
ncbi:hypothetical protein [Maricaulis sp.]|uniref:hypothetical protein n=1 Tax=Maricaulis sp. TaxID=1486257 RepID=UPI0032971594